MRVTEKMLYEGSLANVASTRSKLSQAQNEISSGKRVETPGDDPAAAALVVQHRTSQARLDAIGTAAQRAADELNAADAAMSEIGNLLGRAQQIATQLGSDSYSAQDRQAAAEEVDGISRQTISLLNTRFGDRYIFGGFKDGAEPFDATGGYHGDGGVRQVEIAPGVLEDASVRADSVVAGAGGGANLLATLNGLAASLRANDGSAVRAALGPLDQSSNQLATGRTRIGTSVNLFEAAVQQCSDGVSQEKVLIGQLADADVLDASTRLSLAQYALDASLSAAAKSFQLSLVDKLR